MSLIFSNFVVSNHKVNNLKKIFIMRNLAASFGKILDICKKFSKNLVDERGNMPRDKFMQLESKGSDQLFDYDSNTTAHGECYHADSTCHTIRNRNFHAISLDRAQQLSKRPCSFCVKESYNKYIE